eukprot:NODE_2923_length_1313_cov_125.239496_g2774_i0.p1 GENE.NODE_2923_length_1313_cov_125.239496_g2774_i0~~NODE_2923_length_1313_cov_125.239496_g2774_i0.p1  ORF type:complete len:349 (+),score=76.83 NODE_2923_length_1313_cov_125.239496_g2774_i0:95-1141(+)
MAKPRKEKESGDSKPSKKKTEEAIRKAAALVPVPGASTDTKKPKGSARQVHTKKAAESFVEKSFDAFKEGDIRGARGLWKRALKCDKGRARKVARRLHKALGDPAAYEVITVVKGKKRPTTPTMVSETLPPKPASHMPKGRTDIVDDSDMETEEEKKKRLKRKHKCTVQLNNCPWETDAGMVYELFPDAEDVKMVATPRGLPSGAMQVTFPNAKEASAALELGEVTLAGRTVEIVDCEKLVPEKPPPIMSKRREQREKAKLEKMEKCRFREVQLKGCPESMLAQDAIQALPGATKVKKCYGAGGRFNGDAFVRFSNADSAMEAFNTHKVTICGREVQILRAGRLSTAI